MSEKTPMADVRAGAGPLHDERRLPIAPGRERDDVVAAFGRRHRMRARKLLEPGLRAAAFEDADVPQHRSPPARALDPRGDLIVVTLEIREELPGELRLSQRPRHEAVDLHLVPR